MRNGRSEKHFVAGARVKRLICIWCGKRCAAFNNDKVCFSQPARIKPITAKQLDRAYVDYAIHSDSFGDRNITSFYTPHGIHMLDSLFCKRIMNFDSEEEAEWIRHELEAIPHLHKIIKDNLTLNLRNYIVDMKKKGTLRRRMRGELWSLIPDQSNKSYYGVCYLGRGTFQKLIYKGSWAACHSKIKDAPKLKYPATYEVTKPGGIRYNTLSFADSREPSIWRESGIEPYGKLRAEYVNVPKTDKDLRMEKFWESIGEKN